MASLVSAVWLVVVARHLSLTEFGDVVLLLALGAIFNTVSDRGLQFVLAEHVAKSQVIHEPTLRTVVARRLVAGAGCALLTGALYLLAAHDRNLEIPLVFAVSILATTVYSSALTAYRALGYVAADGANEILSRIGVLAVGTLWLVNGGGILAVVATYALADVSSAIVVYLTLRARLFSRERPASQPDLSWRATAPMALAMVTTIIYFRIDTYMVGLIRGPASAGLYGAAYRVLEGALIPAAALASLVIAHGARPGADRAAAARRFTFIAVLTTLPPVIAGAILARPLMRLAFGPEFAKAAPIVLVLLLSALPGAVVAALTPLSGIADRRRFATSATAVLAMNVALNLGAIPLWGPAGAAWVNVASQVVLAMLLARVVWGSSLRSRSVGFGGLET
jgi:O-antigen/teichoic acid export membrane protein